MDGCAAAHESISEISHLKNLRSLDISSCKVTDETVSQLTTLVKLTKLRLGDNPITDKSIKYLQGLTQLKTLKLDYCTGLIGSFHTHLISSLQNLRANILGRGLCFMTSLVHLDLGYTSIPRSLASAIRSKLKHLEKLDGYPDLGVYVHHDDHTADHQSDLQYHDFYPSHDAHGSARLPASDNFEPTHDDSSEDVDTQTTKVSQHQQIQFEMKEIHEIQKEIARRTEEIAVVQTDINQLNSTVQELEQNPQKDGKLYTQLYNCYTQLSDLRKKKETLEFEKFQLQHVQRTEEKRLAEISNAGAIQLSM